MSLKPVNITHMLRGVNQNKDSDDNSCSICFMTMDIDNNVCTLNDCQHRFHTNCIVGWFRNGNSSCPCCRDDPLPLDSLQKYGRCKFLCKYAKRKEAPPELKKLVERLKKKEKYLQECHKNIREWKKTKEGKYWIQFDKIHTKLKNKIHSARGTNGLWSLRAEIGAYPIIPFYVPQPPTRNH